MPTRRTIVDWRQPTLRVQRGTPMSRTLIVFYSRTGTTRRVAEQLATTLDAHLLALEEARSRKGMFGYLRSAREALRSSLPPLSPLAHDPGSYDLVVLGTPVWAGHVSSPMRSFLRGNSATLQRVAFFCTYGGRGADTAFLDMQHVLGRPPLATCALKAHEVRSGTHDAALAAFATRLEAGLPATAHRKTRSASSHASTDSSRR